MVQLFNVRTGQKTILPAEDGYPVFGFVRVIRLHAGTMFGKVRITFEWLNYNNDVKAKSMLPRHIPRDQKQRRYTIGWRGKTRLKINLRYEQESAWQPEVHSTPCSGAKNDDVLLLHLPTSLVVPVIFRAAVQRTFFF